PWRRSDNRAGARAHADARAAMGEGRKGALALALHVVESRPRRSPERVRSGGERHRGAHEALEVLDRQRLADPVTLEVVAAARREKIELHLRFDALGDHAQ